MSSQDEFDRMCFDMLSDAVQQLKDVVERQQQQILNLQTANRNLTTRLNRIDRQQREDSRAMY